MLKLFKPQSLGLFFGLLRRRLVAGSEHALRNRRTA